MSNGITPTEYRYTNQRHENSLGLYFYVARWYDPALAHFAQADTLIPGFFNPVSYDRYAYVEWNPIRYTDPSGHWVPIGSDKVDAKIEYTVEDYKQEIEDNYGITLSDDERPWGTHDAITILIALERMSENDTGFLRRIQGGTLLFRNPTDPGGYGGKTYGSRIYFTAEYGQIPYQNVYHEFAHLMDNKKNDAFSKDLGGREVYLSNGMFLFGSRNGYYDRQNIPGYSKQWLFDPSRNRKVKALQHERNDAKDSEGNTPEEEWGDMYANFIVGNLSNDEAGTLRRNYVELMLSIVQ